MEKKYWQNFGELNQSDAFKQATEHEFKEELLPIEELKEEGYNVDYRQKRLTVNGVYNV